MIHEAEIFRNARAHVFAVARKYSLEAGLNVLKKEYKNSMKKAAYKGIQAELYFMMNYGDRYKLTPSLDCGDHTDFTGFLNNDFCRIDVTTSLKYKNISDYESEIDHGHK